LEEVEDRVVDRIHRLVMVKQEITETISGIAKPEVREVLQRFYLSGERWGDIAKAMHFGERYCRSLREKGVTHVEKMLREKRQPEMTA
jgi:hypothetical protein